MDLNNKRSANSTGIGSTAQVSGSWQAFNQTIRAMLALKATRLQQLITGSLRPSNTLSGTRVVRGFCWQSVARRVNAYGSLWRQDSCFLSEKEMSVCSDTNKIELLSHLSSAFYGGFDVAVISWTPDYRPLTSPRIASLACNFFLAVILKLAWKVAGRKRKKDRRERGGKLYLLGLYT